MDDQQMHRLSRAELLKMLLQVTEDSERLARENEELKSRIADRQIRLQESGSIAEAALRLNEVFEHAQQAADQYQENARRASEEALQQAREKCAQMTAGAQAECDALKQSSRETEEAQWERTRQRLDQYIRTHENWKAELQEKIRDDGTGK